MSSVTVLLCPAGPELWQFVLATLPFAVAEGFGPSVAPVQARLAPRGLGAEFFAISTGMLAAFQIVTPCKQPAPACLPTSSNAFWGLLLTQPTRIPLLRVCAALAS